MINAYPEGLEIPKDYLKKMLTNPNSKFYGVKKSRRKLKQIKNELYDAYLEEIEEFSNNLCEPNKMFSILTGTSARELLDYYGLNPIVLTQIYLVSFAKLKNQTPSQTFAINECDRLFKQQVDAGANRYAVQYMLIKKIKDIQSCTELDEIEKIKKHTIFLEALDACQKVNSPFDAIVDKAKSIANMEHKSATGESKVDLSFNILKEKNELANECIKYEPALIRRFVNSKIKFSVACKEYLSNLGMIKNTPDAFNPEIEASNLVLKTLDGLTNTTEKNTEKRATK